MRGLLHQLAWPGWGQVYPNLLANLLWLPVAVPAAWWWRRTSARRHRLVEHLHVRLAELQEQVAVNTELTAAAHDRIAAVHEQVTGKGETDG